jgi:hypothetical protein
VKKWGELTWSNIIPMIEKCSECHLGRGEKAMDILLTLESSSSVE